MNRRPATGADAAMAGAVVIAWMLICAAAGFGLGSLFGLGVPLGLVGLFAGLVVGFLLVYSRYRRI
jgi:hypothetical protein